MLNKKKNIIIVGGGAGGLELATKLGNHLGKKELANITLVDRKLIHVWKPLFHEVAAGYLDSNIAGLSYVAQAREHHFNFKLGTLIDINRKNKTIQLAEITDNMGKQLLPSQNLSYDFLVIALGSISNDFDTPGVADHCIYLDTLEQSNLFYVKLSEALIKLSANPSQKNKLKIAIIGGGATGVELSAELFYSIRQLVDYGIQKIDKESLDITLIEASERLLGVLPEKISHGAENELKKLGVNVKTNTRISQVNENGVYTSTGEFIEAQLIVWAAGVKVPNFMKDIGGLETNKINQLVVNSNLTTTRDTHIFAIGDCCACPQSNGSIVPPRAQAAHQMAMHCHRTLVKLVTQQHIPEDFIFKDKGTLISLSKFDTLGKISAISHISPFIIRGKIARLMYLSLYRNHQIALHGVFKTSVMMLISGLNKTVRPKMKLH